MQEESGGDHPLGTMNVRCVFVTLQAGDTALHVAAGLNHRKSVQLLLEAGTDGNARNKVRHGHKFNTQLQHLKA